MQAEGTRTVGLRRPWQRPSILLAWPTRWLQWGLTGLFLLGLPLLALGFSGDGWAWPDLHNPIIGGLRLPRVLSALVVGAALAAAGAALQALFRNPLADPGLIGASSGAALAAVCVMALGWQGLGLPLAAFGGALAATWLLLLLSKLLGGGDAGLLILGLLLASFCGAITAMILFLSNDLTLRSAISWLSGQLGSSTAASLAWACPLALLGVVGLWVLGRDLDCLMLGEDEAHSLGLQVSRIRLYTTLCCALAVGSAVAIGGIIGFIGMMVPNACALLLGGGRRRLIGVSALAGALFLLAMDTLARGVAYPINLPVGLLAGLCGPIFFAWLFIRQGR